MVSIITVNLNNKDGLLKTIHSIAVQTSRDLEYIIVDGGSVDGSVDVIRQYRDLVSCWISEPDRGIYSGMNKGIARATGDYCLFLNSGDTFFQDDVLERVIPLLKADFVCGDAFLVDSNRVWYAPEMVDDMFWLQRFSLCHQSTFIKTSLLKNRPYDESLRIVGDYEQMAFEFLANHSSYQRIESVICNYSCDGISANHRRSDDEKIRVLDRFRLMGIVEDDELLCIVKRLKPETKHYRLALRLLRLVEKI